MTWLRAFRADMHTLPSLTSSPSRFKSFVRQWALRGVWCHGDPQALRSFIVDNQSSAEWIRLNHYVEKCWCRIEAQPNDREVDEMELESWEDHLGSWTGWISRSGHDVLGLFRDFVDDHCQVIVIDPYFWSPREEEDAAREQFLKTLVNANVRRLTVLARPDLLRWGGKGEARRHSAQQMVSGRMAIDCGFVNAAALDTIRLHDRFYAVLDSACPIDAPRVEGFRLSVSLGLGLAAFADEPHVCSVIALDPRDFKNAWLIYSAQVDWTVPAIKVDTA